jgi:sugar O-acyltransferase (sialic acid O-acetyltransferase NeuD family)
MKKLRKVVILGAGGFASETIDIFDSVNAREPVWDVLGFVIDPEYGAPGTIVNDKPVLGGFDWLRDHRRGIEVICAVGAPELRYRMVRKARDAGISFCTVIHPSAVLTRWVTLGEGTIVTAGCILTNRIRVGNHVHLNLDCTVGHDVTLGDFVTVSPGVHISGNVDLQEGCIIGTGSNLIEKVKVGVWSVVGAGSTVISDIPPNTTAVGVPARVIKTRPDGWHNV